MSLGQPGAWLGPEARQTKARQDTNSSQAPRVAHGIGGGHTLTAHPESRWDGRAGRTPCRAASASYSPSPTGGPVTKLAQKRVTGTESSLNHLGAPLSPPSRKSTTHSSAKDLSTALVMAPDSSQRNVGPCAPALALPSPGLWGGHSQKPPADHLEGASLGAGVWNGASVWGLRSPASCSRTGTGTGTGSRDPASGSGLFSQSPHTRLGCRSSSQPQEVGDSTPKATAQRPPRSPALGLAVPQPPGAFGAAARPPGTLHRPKAVALRNRTLRSQCQADVLGPSQKHSQSHQ